MPEMKALTYIRQNVMLPNEVFIPLWMELTAEDKEDMKKWAIEEGKVLGITITE